MLSSIVRFIFAAVIVLAVQIGARAGTLQIEPVLIDVASPGAASTVSLRNDGTAPINAQIRIFRWSQVDGKENLEPTDDVVASPPAVALAPKTNYVARIVDAGLPALYNGALAPAAEAEKAGFAIQILAGAGLFAAYTAIYQSQLLLHTTGDVRPVLEEIQESTEAGQDMTDVLGLPGIYQAEQRYQVTGEAR